MFRGDVLVVGGGFVGLSAAAAFAQSGARVTVLESHSGHDPRFRGELIHPRGVRGLDVLGLKHALIAAGGVPVRGFAVVPDDAAHTLLPYGVNGGDGMGIDHNAMVATMRAEVSKRPNITLLTGARVDGLLEERGQVRGVRCADGREFTAELVLGADGRQSKVRRLLGLEPKVNNLSYTVAVSVEGDVLPHAGHGHVFLGAPGPILAYPYGRSKVRMCIDVPLTAPKGKALLPFVREQYASFLPKELRDAMLFSLERDGIDGCVNQAIYTQECIAPGAVLIGDSGGCSHPLTATGMTSGIHDVLTLVELVKARGASVSVLAEYQRRRYRFVRAREAFTEALYEVFRAHDEGSKALRAGTFRYWAGSARARAASMGILSGDESRPTAFVAEYARVMGLSTLDVWRDAWKPTRLRRAPSRMKALLSTGLGRLERTFEHAMKTYVSDRSRAA